MSVCSSSSINPARCNESSHYLQPKAVSQIFKLPKPSLHGLSISRHAKNNIFPIHGGGRLVRSLASGQNRPAGLAELATMSFLQYFLTLVRSLVQNGKHLFYFVEEYISNGVPPPNKAFYFVFALKSSIARVGISPFAL